MNFLFFFFALCCMYKSMNKLNEKKKIIIINYFLDDREKELIKGRQDLRKFHLIRQERLRELNKKKNLKI